MEEFSILQKAVAGFLQVDNTLIELFYFDSMTSLGKRVVAIAQCEGTIFQKFSYDSSLELLLFC